MLAKVYKFRMIWNILKFEVYNQICGNFCENPWILQEGNLSKSERERECVCVIKIY